MNDEKKIHRKRSMVWPVFLISLGAIVLLNNLNVIDWNIWLVLTRLWPLLLVVAGLDLIFGRRSGIWASILIIIVIGMFAFGTWIIQATGTFWDGELITQTISYPLGDVEGAEIKIDFSVGELEINSLTESINLLEGELDIFENEKLIQAFSDNAEIANLHLETSGTQSSPPFFLGNLFDNSRNWKILFTDLVPIGLDVNTGAGRAVIDLRDLNLRDLNVDSGVGETIVYLSSKGSYSATISVGVGHVIVYVPEEIAARIQLNIGIGDSSVNGDYQRSGVFYTSPDYEESKEQVEIVIEGGIGDIEVIQIP